MSIEFYVIISFVAAAVIAAAAKPARRRAVRNFYYPASLEAAADVSAAPAAPSIELRVLDDGTVRLRREGIQGLRADGSLCLAVAVSGFDVSIEERLSPGRAGESAPAAEVVLDCFGPERYHISYRCPHAGGPSTALQLNIRPGNRIFRPLEI